MYLWSKNYSVCRCTVNIRRRRIYVAILGAIGAIEVQPLAIVRAANRCSPGDTICLSVCAITNEYKHVIISSRMGQVFQYGVLSHVGARKGWIENHFISSIQSYLISLSSFKVLVLPHCKTFFVSPFRTNDIYRGAQIGFQSCVQVSGFY